jgi:hypothetical protein
MWKYEDSIPRFPLPPLNDTLDRFLQVVKPLVSPEEHLEYAKKVEAFRNKEGPWLHTKLEVCRCASSSYSPGIGKGFCQQLDRRFLEFYVS